MNRHFILFSLALHFIIPFSYGQIELIVLGNMQDGGSPHIGCEKSCCSIDDPDKMVVSLAVNDHSLRKSYLFEATPDISRQLKLLPYGPPTGIFLTHAHIGHYTGLMYFGREAFGGSDILVYAMPRMKSFLENNGPWDQLVTLKNIRIEPLKDSVKINFNSIKIRTIRVPHKDEYSETVGFIISGPNNSAVFIPDIDKWYKLDNDIRDIIKKVDYAFLDGSFYDAKEINNRDISEIPHPFLVESIELFGNLSNKDKSKIHFIHFNHTNPVLNKDSEARKTLERAGFSVAGLGDTFEM